MTRRWLKFPAFLAIALVLVASLMAGSSRILAQEASPEADLNTGGLPGSTPRPAHIHSGNCDALNEVVVPLNDLVAAVLPGTPIVGVENADGATPTDPLASPTGTFETPPYPDDDTGPISERSETVVQMPLNDILAAEHAINVHESAENIQNYIACGDITGTPTDGQLVIQMGPQGDSNFEGTATLTDNGDGTTTVLVEISSTSVDAIGSPAASPVA